MAEGDSSRLIGKRGTARRATDDGNPGTFVGIETREGVAYARYRAKQGTWVSSSLAQQGYDKKYGKDVAYGAYLGVARTPSGQPLENPDKIKPGQEYLVPVGNAGKPTIQPKASEDLPPNGLRPSPTERERGTQPVRPPTYSAPSFPPWVEPEAADATRQHARREEVRALRSKIGQAKTYRPDTSDLTGNEYHYHRDVVLGNVSEHPLSTTPLDRRVMSALQEDPNRFFPFNVLPLHGEHGIELNGEYALAEPLVVRVTWRSLFLPPGGPYPVRVTEVTPRSFTFTTLPGHFDAPGSTIRFSTYLDAVGNVHFVHDGDAKQSSDLATNLLAPVFAPNFVWPIQEYNLKSWLEDDVP